MKKIVNGQEVDLSPEEESALQAQWAAHAPPSADDMKRERVEAVQDGILLMGHNHENRLRALEGKAAVTMAQFKAAIKALL